MKSDKMENQTERECNKDGTKVFDLFYYLVMIGVGALSGSTASLVFGLEGGIVGSLLIGCLFGVLSLIAKKRINGNAKC
jgi:hypothetical protein